MPPKSARRDVNAQDWVRALSTIRRGDVLRVELRGAEGRELQAPHFCVVLSSKDWIGQGDQTVVVVPLGTHGGRPTPKTYEVLLKAGDGGLPHDGVAIPRQIRTLSTNRVSEIWHQLSSAAMIEIEEMLVWGLGLYDEDET